MSVGRAVAVIVAAWLTLDLVVVLLLARVRRRRPIFHPVDEKEAPGGLQR